MVLLKINFKYLRFLRSRETLTWYRSIVNFPCTKNGETDHLKPANTTEIHKAESHRRIPTNIDEYKELKRLKPCQPINPHLLRVSILGEPNVGKSTLTNSLVKWKVCAVSSKVHTTRKKATAILVEDNKQIVFLDTPGFVTPELTKKHSLEPAFVMDPVRSIQDADLIAVVVDIANKWTNNRINENILDILEKYENKKSILILNKVDAMKSKDRVMNLIKILTAGKVGGITTAEFEKTHTKKELTIYDILKETNKAPTVTDASENIVTPISTEKQNRGWPNFSRVFMVSALKHDGIDSLREYLFNETLPHDWMYHDNTITDQHPHEIALTIVREKLLEYLPQEIPYRVNLTISTWEMLSSGCPKIAIKILCSNARYKRFIIGPNGQHIAACADKARKAMREAFRKDVVLHLAVN